MFSTWNSRLTKKGGGGIEGFRTVYALKEGYTQTQRNTDLFRAAEESEKQKQMAHKVEGQHKMSKGLWINAIRIDALPMNPNISYDVDYVGLC